MKAAVVRNDPFQRLVGGLRLVEMVFSQVWEVRTHTLPSQMMEAQLVPRLLTGAETACAQVLDRGRCHPPGDSKELRTEETQTEAGFLSPRLIVSWAKPDLVAISHDVSQPTVSHPRRGPGSRTEQ